jgi:hypothetical protein
MIGNFTWTKTTSQIGAATGAFFLSSSGAVTNGTATNPDLLYNGRQSYNQWTSHLDGTYQAKWGIRITPTLRMQEGLPVTETFAVTGLNVGTIYLPVAPTGAFRNPDLYVFDTRIEKDFRIKERFRINGFVDLFNIFNSNAANVVGNVIGVTSTKISAPGNPLDGTTSTYQKFLAPTTVLPPRVMRLGVRFTF